MAGAYIFVYLSVQTERQAALWLVQTLREQCELLEIMLLYYRNVDISACQLLGIVTKFKVSSLQRQFVQGEPMGKGRGVTLVFLCFMIEVVSMVTCVVGDLFNVYRCHPLISMSG